jgi:hypothetical protein
VSPLSGSVAKARAKAIAPAQILCLQNPIGLMTSVACPFAVVGVSFDPSLGFQLSYQNLPKSIISVAFHKYGKTVIDRSGGKCERGERY